MNPFGGYGKCVTGERFVGREKYIKRISERIISRSGSLSIVGLPRIGKTSLISEVVDRIHRMPDKQLIVIEVLDLSTLPDSIHFWGEIIDSIVAECTKEQKNLPDEFYQIRNVVPTDEYAAFKRCKEALTALHHHKIDILLPLDEFDAILKFTDAKIVIQQLREMIDHQEKTGLSVAFISRRSLLSIERQLKKRNEQVSNLEGVCEPLYLRFLDDAGIQSMLDRLRNRLQLSNEDEAQFQYYTKGHPYLMEMVLCHSWDEESIEAGIEVSKTEIFAYYECLRERLTEDDLFDQLLQLTVGPCYSLRTDTRARMLSYGLIGERSGEKNTYYAGWSGHFQEYLEKCSRDFSQDFLSETERSLCHFIEKKCSEQHGIAWLDILTKRHDSIKKIVEFPEKGWQFKREKDKRNGFVTSEKLMHYADIMDLWTLMGAEWELFRKYFKKDGKGYWQERFEKLSQIRLPFAHPSRPPLPEHMKGVGMTYCKEILEVIALADKSTPPNHR